MVTLPYQQKVLLLALFVYIKRTEALTVPLRMLQEDLKWVCECVKLDYCRKIIDDGLPELEQYSLIALSKKQGETRIMLKVSLNEIEASYGDNIIFKRFFDND